MPPIIAAFWDEAQKPEKAAIIEVLDSRIILELEAEIMHIESHWCLAKNNGIAFNNGCFPEIV